MSLEYDETLRAFLLENGFTFKNVMDIGITNALVMRHIRRYDTQGTIASFQRHWPEDKAGTIFTLPGGRRDNMEYLYMTRMTSQEIRRIVAMKAFL
jgi:hypothetical protein